MISDYQVFWEPALMQDKVMAAPPLVEAFCNSRLTLSTLCLYIHVGYAQLSLHGAWLSYFLTSCLSVWGEDLLMKLLASSFSWLLSHLIWVLIVARLRWLRISMFMTLRVHLCYPSSDFIMYLPQVFSS